MNTTSTVVCDACGHQWQSLIDGPCDRCLTGEGHILKNSAPIDPHTFGIRNIGPIPRISAFPGERAQFNRDGSGYRCMPMRGAE